MIRRMTLRLLSTGLICATLTLVAPSALGETAASPDGRTPDQVVERFHSSLIQMMKEADALGFSGRCDFIRPVLGESFDLSFMGSKAVGRHWRKLSEEEQQLWLGKFERLTVSNYAGRFSAFSGEAFETLGDEPAARDTIVVMTRLNLPSDEDVLLNYRLFETPSGWRIIDVYLNGTVSELALRRSEYSSALKRDGFQHLTAAIDEKIAELEKKGGG
jgi:phospholipid transport system substrate-binding protein